MQDNHYYEDIQKYDMWLAGWDDNDSAYVIEDETGWPTGLTPNKKLYKELLAEYYNNMQDGLKRSNHKVYRHSLRQRFVFVEKI